MLKQYSFPVPTAQALLAAMTLEHHFVLTTENGILDKERRKSDKNDIESVFQQT